jgi:hypothetical protein
MRYFCLACGKSVTSELPEDAVIRAVIHCPECYARGDTEALNRWLESLHVTQGPPARERRPPGFR